MKGWIELNVRCYTEQGSQLEELGIDDTDDDIKYYWRIELFQISNICSISKEQCKGITIMYVSGSSCEIKETSEEIINKIIRNKETFES
jgi:hypothetical protein